MPDMTPQGLETTWTREELLRARDADARRIRLTDPKGRRQGVTVRCMHCARIRGPVVVDRTAWQAYVTERLLVQEVFPDLSPDEREVLRGARSEGIYLCPQCSVDRDEEE
jgi:uncharacterized lipoprotein